MRRVCYTKSFFDHKNASYVILAVIVALNAIATGKIKQNFWRKKTSKHTINGLPRRKRHDVIHFTTFEGNQTWFSDLMRLQFCLLTCLIWVAQTTKTTITITYKKNTLRDIISIINNRTKKTTFRFVHWESLIVEHVKRQMTTYAQQNQRTFERLPYFVCLCLCVKCTRILRIA